jgi:DNA repair exonuclease SbcCD nuclease subunit
MKVLFVGDVHVKLTNLQQIEKLEREIMEKFREKKNEISFVVVAGDVLDDHEKILTPLLNRAYGLIKTIRKIAPVYVLVGNHDYINNQQFLTDCHWMNGMKEWKDVCIVDHPIVIKKFNKKFAFVPYVPNGKFFKALEKIPSWKSVECIFAHQEMKHCKMGVKISEDGDEWNDDYPMLISGHIHERQRIGTKVLYPGSVINHAFGSDNQGITELTFEDGCEMKENRIDINLVKKHIHYEKISNFHEIPKSRFVPNVKICLSGTYAEVKVFKATEHFDMLKRSNVKVSFKISKERSEERNVRPASKRDSVMQVFERLVAAEKDSELQKDFDKIKGDNAYVLA